MSPTRFARLSRRSAEFDLVRLVGSHRCERRDPSNRSGSGGSSAAGSAATSVHSSYWSRVATPRILEVSRGSVLGKAPRRTGTGAHHDEAEATKPGTTGVRPRRGRRAHRSSTGRSVRVVVRSEEGPGGDCQRSVPVRRHTMPTGTGWSTRPARCREPVGVTGGVPGRGRRGHERSPTPRRYAAERDALIEPDRRSRRRRGGRDPPGVKCLTPSGWWLTGPMIPSGMDGPEHWPHPS